MHFSFCKIFTESTLFPSSLGYASGALNAVWLSCKLFTIAGRHARSFSKPRLSFGCELFRLGTCYHVGPWYPRTVSACSDACVPFYFACIGASSSSLCLIYTQRYTPPTPELSLPLLSNMLFLGSQAPTLPLSSVGGEHCGSLAIRSKHLFQPGWLFLLYLAGSVLEESAFPHRHALG